MDMNVEVSGPWNQEEISYWLATMPQVLKRLGFDTISITEPLLKSSSGQSRTISIQLMPEGSQKP